MSTENDRSKKQNKTQVGQEKKECFLICPIGDPGSVDRRRSGQLEEFILKPALEDEYTIVRADRIPDPGMIPPQIVLKLIEADLVIADLSDCNPNVFYELAIRHAIQKPFIHMMEETQLQGKKLPFDNAGMRTIPYPGDFESDKALVCREKVKETVEAAFRSPESLLTPVSNALINKITLELKAKGGAQSEVIARMFTMLIDIRTTLSSLVVPYEFILKMKEKPQLTKSQKQGLLQNIRTAIHSLDDIMKKGCDFPYEEIRMLNSYINKEIKILSQNEYSLCIDMALGYTDTLNNLLANAGSLELPDVQDTIRDCLESIEAGIANYQRIMGLDFENQSKGLDVKE